MRQTDEISHVKIWTWLRKENLKSVTESLGIAAHNNTITTNYLKAKTEKKKTQQNNK